MKLIDKDALVAEMKRRIFNLEQLGDRNFIETHFTEQFRFIKIYEGIIDFINTIEVKEVDLDSNIKAYLTNHFNVYEDGVLQSKKSSHPLSTYDIIKVAKYFFELGLKQSSSDEFKLCESQILLEDDGGEPPYDGKQWLDLSCKEYEIPYDKFKDGDKIEIVIRKIKKGE